MMISIPLFDKRRGDVVAVLMANLRFKPVWDLLAGMELPNEGDVYVLNRAGQVAAHRNPDIVLSGRTVNLMVKEGRGMGLTETDVFLASQALGFGEQEILIVAEQPASSALELAETNTRLYLIVVTLSVTAAITLAVLAADQIVRPVEQLAVAARAMGRTDFSIRVESPGKGEIGVLARTFNAMQVELQRLITGLQQEVIERRKAEAALRIANEQLQELDQMKSKFISDMSHELRTPVTTINLYLELFTSGKPESRDKYEAILREQSGRLTSLFNSILDFSNLQKSLHKANLASIDLNALVAKVVAGFEQLALTRGLKLSFTPSANASHVWGDAEQLKQVVNNLLQNAISYTLSGHVRFSAHRTRARVIRYD